MRFAAKPVVLLLPLLLLLSLAIPARGEAEPGVRDDAKFFSPEAARKANDDLKEIRKQYGKDLVIETFASIPDDRKAAYEAAKGDKQQVENFFGQWLGDRARELKVNGVYVLICRDPSHLEVKSGHNTVTKEFTEENQKRLTQILLKAFREKKHDEGLNEAVSYFREALRQNLGGNRSSTASGTENFHYRPGPGGGAVATPSNLPPPSSPPRGGLFHGRSCMWIVLLVIGAFILIRILARMGGSRTNYGGGPGPGPGYGPGSGYGPGPGYGGGGYGGGGGGFFRSVFGGLLGGAAGSYIYDQFRHRGDNYSQPGSPAGGTYVPPDNTSANTPDDQGQGFESGASGGDFGGSSDSGSSGGDFGSSDSGSTGGDFGGSSDSGGSSDFGSSDSGSTGGDF